MKLFRYRKPSLKTLLGVTKLKRRIKKATGISAIQSLSPSRVKQKIKYDGGYNKPIFKHTRELSKGKVPSLFGLFSKLFK
jgi:hypothetical protein